MSIADGIRMGMGLINDSQAAKAREEELKAWREERDDKKARNLVLDANMEQTLAALGKTEDTVSPFLNQQGLAPMSTYYEGQQGAYNRRQGFGAAPDEVTQAEPINLPKRDNTLVMGQLKAMQAARDSAGFYSVANQDKKDRLAHGAAQIQRYVASNATPDQIKAFSEKYTAEARIPGKMKFDPASGMTTIDLDSGESVKLDRQQFGSYLAGLYRQEQGDSTASADIAGIHKALGEQADKMFSRQTGVVKVNNDVAKENNDNRYRNGMLGIAQQRASSSSSGSQNGINSDAIDGYLVPNLGSVNAEGTKVPANPAVINLVRSVAFQLPQAVTDPKGAAYTAHIAWTKALTAAGGDEQKASALLQQALQPASPAQAAPPANPPLANPGQLPPPAKKVTMQSTVNTPTYTKWMQAKSARDDLLSKASKMSKESAAVYLQARLPQIEAVIKANENYQVQ